MAAWKGQWMKEDESEIWVVLARVPHVVEDGYLKPGIDNLLKFREPPGATRLVVHRNIAPRRKTIDDNPYIVDGDWRGRFLLCATQGPEPEAPVLDAFYSEPIDANHGLPKAYFICDTRTGRHSSTRLPDHGRPILNPRNACLLNLSAEAFAVAELQPTVGADHATLLLYESASGVWNHADLNYPPRDHPWGGHGVIMCNGEIWWVDLSYGFLAFDATNLALRFVPLPDGCELPPGEAAAAAADVEKRRCVGTNIGELRYVQIDERDGDPIVRMWTLLDEDAGMWSFDCVARFEAIWDDEGYKATKLPREIPAVAFVHPEHPGEVAYFFLNSRVFGVHLRKCRVLDWKFFEMLHPPMAYHSSRFVRLWRYIPALRDAPGFR
uniref:DUF1618 domain-containing protein n=1 Tax=Leersia perrieri TaxID=77586 RepID=A0A0D9UYZ8_9ORYZ